MNTALEKIRGNGAEVYRIPALERLGFTAIVSGRGGGVSPAPYDSLNTDPSGGDAPSNTRENVRRIMEAAGMERLWTPSQVHGDAVAVVDSPRPHAACEADAVITVSPAAAVGVRTADCLPILIADPFSGAAAAIHAGRRSAELHIAIKTVGMMVKSFGCDPGRLAAFLGPRIGKCCYEVDVDSAERFCELCGGSGGRMIDLSAANIRQLKEAGLKGDNIIDCGICVSCENKKFFSYRADGGTTGRFISAITARKGNSGS